MTDECISPLRRRMIEDMTVRNFVAKTQTDYIRRVKNFAVFLGRSPDTATREDVRRYLLHLASSGMGAGTVNGTGSALRFLFDITLDRPDIVRNLPVAREPRKAPVILSPEEVARMLEAAPGVKYKAALSVAYGAGLRVSEVVALKVSDIDSARMMIRIEPPQGPLCDAVAAAARPVARLVAGLPLAGLVVPGTRSTPADHHTPAHPRLPHGCAGGRDREARVSAYAAAQLCHPSFGEECRCSGDPSAARTYQARHDGALHAGRDQYDPQRHQPARSSHRQEGRAAHLTRGADGTSSSGGRGHLPRPRARLA